MIDLSSYVAEKYSGILCVDNILELFRMLSKKYGSIAKAAKECGLERKTIYLWDDAGYIKPITKKKVVDALIEIEPEKTLSYILNKSVEDATELLYINISNLYEKIIEEYNKEKIKIYTELLEQILDEYSGLIINRIHTEIIETIFNLRNNLITKDVVWIPEPFNLCKTVQLESIIQVVAKELQTKESQKVALEFNLPKSLVNSILNAMNISFERFLELEYINLIKIYKEELLKPEYPTKVQITAAISEDFKLKYIRPPFSDDEVMPDQKTQATDRVLSVVVN